MLCNIALSNVYNITSLQRWWSTAWFDMWHFGLVWQAVVVPANKEYSEHSASLNSSERAGRGSLASSGFHDCILKSCASFPGSRFFNWWALSARRVDIDFISLTPLSSSWKGWGELSGTFVTAPLIRLFPAAVFFPLWVILEHLYSPWAGCKGGTFGIQMDSINNYWTAEKLLILTIMKWFPMSPTQNRWCK